QPAVVVVVPRAAPIRGRKATVERLVPVPRAAVPRPVPTAAPDDVLVPLVPLVVVDVVDVVVDHTIARVDRRIVDDRAIRADRTVGTDRSIRPPLLAPPTLARAGRASIRADGLVRPPLLAATPLSRA